MDSGRVIVTTNALGMGVDIPDVRMVVHAGAPRRLRDYAQESGRAGRDGLRSTAVVVWAGQAVRKEGDKQEEKWLDEGMEAFVQGSGCRRAVLDSVIDGFEREGGCEEGEESCDVCKCEEVEEEEVEEVEMEEEVEEVEMEEEEVEEEEEAEEVEEVEEEEAEEVEEVEGGKDRHMVDFLQLRSREIREQQQATRRAVQEAEEVVVFQRLLESWIGRCAACWLLGSDDLYHTMEACPREDSGEWAQVWCVKEQVEKEVFRKRRLERYSGCFYCGVPQGLYGRWASNCDDGGRFTLVRGGVYQYKDTMV
jgi:superfamily II DNA helicase RecQ